MTTAADIARERQMDWLLAETLGGSTTGRAHAMRERWRWFAAAMMVLAVGTAFAVAVLRDRDGGARQAQDPAREPQWHEAHGPAALADVPADVVNLRCFDFDDAALAQLSRFEKVERLDLGNTDLDDRGYAKALQITDAGVAHLGKMRNLRWLSLQRCHEVKGEGLRALEAIPMLEHLDLTYSGVESPAIERLPRLTSLRELTLTACMNFHGRSLAEVAKITGLRRLELRACTTLSSQDILPLAELTELRHLDLRDCNGRFSGQRDAGPPTGGGEPPPPPVEDSIGITDASVAVAVAKLPLETLLLGGSVSLTDRVGKVLAGMRTLRHLDLHHLPNTTAALLGQVPPDLESLALDENVQFDGAALRSLPPLPRLRELGLSGLQTITVEDLEALLKGKSLHVLRLGGPSPIGKSAAGPTPPVRSGLTAAAGAVVAGQRELRRLDLTNAKWVNAAFFAALVPLTELADLDLTLSSAYTAEALAPLARCPALRSVKLAWCNRLDAAALRALAGAPLQQLDLYGTNLAVDDVREIAKSWPGCMVTMPKGNRYRVPDKQ